jgi:hypothetical protein
MQNAFSDFATKDPRIQLKRREHVHDSNKDALSDLETVDLHILNTTQSDIGYYLCIVANSLKSFRVTYAFLNVDLANVVPNSRVTNGKLENESKEKTSNQRTTSSVPLPMHTRTHFFEGNNYIYTLITLFCVFLILFISASFCFCFFQLKRTRSKFESETMANRKIFEKTLGSMQKVTYGSY